MPKAVTVQAQHHPLGYLFLYQLSVPRVEYPSWSLIVRVIHALRMMVKGIRIDGEIFSQAIGAFVAKSHDNFSLKTASLRHVGSNVTFGSYCCAAFAINSSSGRFSMGFMKRLYWQIPRAANTRLMTGRFLGPCWPICFSAPASWYAMANKGVVDLRLGATEFFRYLRACFTKRQILSNQKFFTQQVVVWGLSGHRQVYLVGNESELV